MTGFAGLGKPDAPAVLLGYARNDGVDGVSSPACPPRVDARTHRTASPLEPHPRMAAVAIGLALEIGLTGVGKSYHINRMRVLIGTLSQRPKFMR